MFAILISVAVEQTFVESDEKVELPVVGEYNAPDLIAFLSAHDTEIVSGIRVKVTNAHTEGHQMVLLNQGGERLAFLGDLIPTRTNRRILIRTITTRFLRRAVRLYGTPCRFRSFLWPRGRLQLMHQNSVRTIRRDRPPSSIFSVH